MQSSRKFIRISATSASSIFRKGTPQNVTTQKTAIYIDKFSRYVTCPNSSLCLTSEHSSQNLSCNILTKVYYPRFRVNEHFSKCRGRSSGWSSWWRVSDIIRCAVRTARGPTSRAATSCLNRQKPASFALERHTVIARVKSWSSRSFRHIQVSCYAKSAEIYRQNFFITCAMFCLLQHHHYVYNDNSFTAN